MLVNEVTVIDIFNKPFYLSSDPFIGDVWNSIWNSWYGPYVRYEFHTFFEYIRQSKKIFLNLSQTLIITPIIVSYMVGNIIL